MNESKKKLLVLGLGSNLGNRYAYIMEAIFQIEKAFEVVATKASIYQSEPWGEIHQPRFLNTVISFETSLSAEKCLSILQQVEQNLGRKKEKKWGPRCIDIDILLFGSEMRNEQGLIIPHPHMLERDFVMVPLHEICSNVVHPIENKSIDQLRVKSNSLKLF